MAGGNANLLCELARVPERFVHDRTSEQRLALKV